MVMKFLTTNEIIKAIEILKTMGDFIKEKGRMSSGELYAVVMNYMSLKEYDYCISVLVKTGIIKVENNELIYLEKK